MRIDTAARRARLVAGHLLVPAARVADPVVVADAVVALHATDPATVFLSAAARMTEPGVAAVERALYEDRTLLRLLAMRRTMFVVSAGLSPVVNAGAARAIAAKQRVGLLRLAESGGWDERRLADVERAVLAALARRGSATASELAQDVPALRERVVLAAGTRNEATQNVNSHVLRILAAENRIRRDRPRGGWTSSQFRWSLASAVADLPCPRPRPGTEATTTAGSAGHGHNRDRPVLPPWRENRNVPGRNAPACAPPPRLAAAWGPARRGPPPTSTWTRPGVFDWRR